jgi:hypothetical protein
MGKGFYFFGFVNMSYELWVMGYELWVMSYGL